jgi:uncharacterized protein (TIRG00374 family)
MTKKVGQPATHFAWLRRTHAPEPRFRLGWVRRGAAVLLFLAVLEYLVLPQIAGTRKALDTLLALQPGWLLLGVALEVASLVGFSLLTRSVLPDQRPSYSWILRSDITGLGVSHVVPAGAAAAGTLRYRLLREGGAPAEDVVVGLAVQGVGSMLALVAMLWVVLVASIPLIGIHIAYVITATIGAVFIALAVGLLIGVSRGHERTRTLAHRLIRPLPTKAQGRVERVLHEGAIQVAQLLADRRGLRSFALWATWNWVFDAASLWVFLAAYGWRADPIGLAVGYGLANVAAALPISPGGLGVIEGVLIPSLVGFGGPSAAVVLGVVSWRLFEFWAPIPAAGVCYLSLRTHDWRESRAFARGWNEMKDLFANHEPGTGLADAESPRQGDEGD